MKDFPGLLLHQEVSLLMKRTGEVVLLHTLDMLLYEHTVCTPLHK